MLDKSGGELPEPCLSIRNDQPTRSSRNTDSRFRAVNKNAARLPMGVRNHTRVSPDRRRGIPSRHTVS